MNVANEVVKDLEAMNSCGIISTTKLKKCVAHVEKNVVEVTEFYDNGMSIEEVSNFLAMTVK